VIGVAAVASRDVQQVVTNRNYSQLYDNAENGILEFVDKYGDIDQPLVSLTNPANIPSGYNCQPDIAIPGAYKCTRTDGTDVNELTIYESKDVVEYELAKDKSFLVDLGGYRGNLQFTWTGDTALEFGLVYTNAGKYYMIGDLYDTNTPTVFTDNGGDPLSDPQGNHKFAFTSLAGGVQFNVGSTIDLPAGAATLYLRVTARMQDNPGSTLLSISGPGAGFRNQVRVFHSYSYSSLDDVDVLADVVTQVPLFPQVAPIFHYVLLVDSAVTKSL
ncbi:hypothetical protein KC640_02920, partial [Candidatus Dojkabacteria bacterium]|nr:hypothetical protein [Candidatus Dojkabacteria bacterium]